MQSIVVLAGGNSAEREVSLRSGAAVAVALKERYAVTVLDPADGLEEQLEALQAADVVFPALHGAGGEDGGIQQFFETHDLKFVGSDSKASALCFDKFRYGALLAEHGYHTPQTEVVTAPKYETSQLTGQPHVLKPNDGGSSIDTFIMRDPANPPKEAIAAAFSRHDDMLLQTLIEGQEITVAVLGNEALPVIEIIAPDGQEFDYENKYNGASQELCPPQHVNPDHQAEAQRLASAIHTLTGCRDMSRTDFIINPIGELYVLETNTIPGLTDQSLLPKAAAVAGHDMPTLCSQLVEAALRRV